MRAVAPEVGEAAGEEAAAPPVTDETLEPTLERAFEAPDWTDERTDEAEATAPVAEAETEAADSEAEAASEGDSEGEAAASVAEGVAAEASPEAPAAPPWPAQRVPWRAVAASTWSGHCDWMHWRAPSTNDCDAQMQAKSVTPEQPAPWAPWVAQVRMQGLMVLGSSWATATEARTAAAAKYFIV
jgi:hypothetical protein